MSRSNKERRRKMRLNIIRHRQQLFEYLDNVNDTVLKPRIILDAIDLKELNLNTITTTNTTTTATATATATATTTATTVAAAPTAATAATKQPLVVSPIEIKEKEEEESTEMSDTSYDEMISVGSNEGWDDDFSLTSDQAEVDSGRKSERSDSVDGLRKLSDSGIRDHDYYSDDTQDDKVVRKRSWGRPNLATLVSDSGSDDTCTRRKRLVDIELHKIKERQLRKLLARRFHELRQLCSDIECSRRVPSKCSTLLAAEKECSVLKDNECHLIEEKNNLQKENVLLTQKMLKLRYNLTDPNQCVYTDGDSN